MSPDTKSGPGLPLPRLMLFDALYVHRMSLTQLVVVSRFLRSTLGVPLFRRRILRRVLVVQDLVESAAPAGDAKSHHTSYMGAAREYLLTK